MIYACRYCHLTFDRPSMRQAHEIRIHQTQETPMPQDKSEIRRRINMAYHIDQKALEIAQRVDDIYAVGGLHVAQRTSRIQLLIIDALEMWVRDALTRNGVPEGHFK